MDKDTKSRGQGGRRGGGGEEEKGIEREAAFTLANLIVSRQCEWCKKLQVFGSDLDHVDNCGGKNRSKTAGDETTR